MPYWMAFLWMLGAISLSAGAAWIGRGMFDRYELKASRDEVLNEGYRQGWNARGRQEERRIALSPLAAKPAAPEPATKPGKPSIGQLARQRVTDQTIEITRTRSQRDPGKPPTFSELTDTAIGRWLDAGKADQPTQLSLNLWQDAP